MRYIDAYMNVRFYNFHPKDESLTFRKKKLFQCYKRRRNKNIESKCLKRRN